MPSVLRWVKMWLVCGGGGRVGIRPTVSGGSAERSRAPWRRTVAVTPPVTWASRKHLVGHRGAQEAGPGGAPSPRAA